MEEVQAPPWNRGASTSTCRHQTMAAGYCLRPLSLTVDRGRLGQNYQFSSRCAPSAAAVAASLLVFSIKRVEAEVKRLGDWDVRGRWEWRWEQQYRLVGARESGCEGISRGPKLRTGGLQDRELLE